jgi:hypothetical protein
MTVVAAQNMFKGLGDADIFQRGKFFQPDFDGIVIIRKTILKNTRAKGLAFIVEFEVKTSNLVDKHPVGSKGSWFQKLQDTTVAFPAIRAWAAACAGYETNQIAEINADEALRSPVLDELVNDAVSSPDNNDYCGVELRLVTTLVKTKEKTDFTRYDFSPIAG